jgi:hypothetical protein
MKNKVIELNNQLKAVHRRFLENEKFEAQKKLERQLSPFDFFNLLTQDQNFAWLRPFSTLLADIDAFLDDTPAVNINDLARIHEQVTATLQKPGSQMASRFEFYKNQDAEFAFLFSKFQTLLDSMSDENKTHH